MMQIGFKICISFVYFICFENSERTKQNRILFAECHKQKICSFS